LGKVVKSGRFNIHNGSMNNLIVKTSTMGGEAGQSRPHFAIVPSPGIGHLIPLTELATRLLGLHDLSLTFLIPTDGSPTRSQVSLLQSLPSSINYKFLPSVDLTDLPANASVTSRILYVMSRSLPALTDSLSALAESNDLVAVLVDLFGTPLLDLPRLFGVPAYIFYTCSAFSLSGAFHLTKLHGRYTCEYRDLPEPVKFFPSSVPVHGRDFTESAQDRKAEAYKRFLHMVDQYKKPAGLILNSFQDLEPGALKALSSLDNIPPIYVVGPLIQADSNNRLTGSDPSLKWLDEQPSRSVIFVSFGSGGTLSRDQLTELAFGLEMSGQRFLWVIKSPNDGAPNASYFSQESIANPFHFLPDGFLHRTKGVGLVVPSWAPQIQILSHGSTGGFLTHCGWNSTLESIVNGVPLLAWPLFAEQRLNAVQLTEDLKVALRVKPNAKGIVERRQIADYVNELIRGEEGKILRKRMEVLKDSAKATLGEHGSSTKQLADFVRICNAEGHL
ncbi:hypothetical protein Dimus_030732, partial [Dionaea muscipula]